jgi:hypothetical protein
MMENLGLCPKPRSLSPSGLPEGQKKEKAGIAALPLRKGTYRGARVALQQCSILRVGIDTIRRRSLWIKEKKFIFVTQTQGQEYVNKSKQGQVFLTLNNIFTMVTFYSEATRKNS